jgi:hypothetical protein
MKIQYPDRAPIQSASEPPGMSPILTGLGVILIIGSVLGGWFAMRMKTTVETGYSEYGSSTVNNIGLLADRQMYITFCVTALLLGVILVAACSLADSIREHALRVQTAINPPLPATPIVFPTPPEQV